jgi:hypothetical protein
MTENSKLRSDLAKKEEESKGLYIKITDLENKLVTSVRQKMNE